MILAIAAGLLLVCTGFAWWAAPPVERSVRWTAAGLAAIATAVAITGFVAGSATALDLAAAALLACVAAGLGRAIFQDRTWPARMFPLAIAIVTATGGYLRAYHLQEIVSAPDRQLQPDVRYYQQQALTTANPFAAGHKSPLWPAMHAPLVRLMTDRDLAMRVLSWAFGIAMLPLIALALGRLFDPLVGILVAGMLAVEPWLIDLCTQGLREECGVCLWMLVLLCLFAGKATWRRVLAAGVLGGSLLLLRNLAVVPLLGMILLAAVQQKWHWRKALMAAVLALVIVSPFYINQYRTFGDAFALEKRDARYHANIEFRGRPTPVGLSMPSPAEIDRDLYAGQPLSPMAYLLKFHSPREFAANQIYGIRRIVAGEPFVQFYSLWLRLACAAGLIAAIFVAGQRFAAIFVLLSTAGMIAHLAAIGSVELRLLLPVMIIWLAAGLWLIVTLARLGLRHWYASQAEGAIQSSPRPAQHENSS